MATDTTTTTSPTQGAGARLGLGDKPNVQRRGKNTHIEDLFGEGQDLLKQSVVGGDLFGGTGPMNVDALQKQFFENNGGDPAKLAQVQAYLYQAGGFYSQGQYPTLGHWTDSDTKALTQAMIAAARQTVPGSPIDVSEFLKNSAKYAATYGPQLPPQVVTVPDAGQVGDALDTAFMDTLGRKATAQERGRFVGAFQGKSVSVQKEAIRQGYLQGRDFEINAAEQGTTPDVARLMEGISHVESGGSYNPKPRQYQAYMAGSGVYGKYQFKRGTFEGAARMAGISNPDIRDPAQQDQAAKALIGSYMDKYKDPRLVAYAWLGGGGSADAIQAGKLDPNAHGDGNNSFTQYADKVMSSAGMSQGAAGPPIVTVEQPSASADAAAFAQQTSPQEAKDYSLVKGYDRFAKLWDSGGTG